MMRACVPWEVSTALPTAEVDEPVPGLAVWAVVAGPENSAEFTAELRWSDAMQVLGVVARAVAVPAE